MENVTMDDIIKATAVKGSILQKLNFGHFTKLYFDHFTKFHFGRKLLRTNFLPQIIYIRKTEDITLCEFYDTYDNKEFYGIFQPFKAVITNVNLTKLDFIRKFWPKRFHKIDPRLATWCRRTLSRSCSKKSRTTEMSAISNIRGQSDRGSML
jgi:hypothetical protein